MAYAVIMAGGRGERFWPLSRADRPKQFLNLFGDRTMFQQAVDRAACLVGHDRILVVTSAGFVDLVREQVPEIPAPNILQEPVGRDTAAAVGLAAVEICARDPDGIMAVLPADHYVGQRDRFLEVLRGAVAASAGGGHLVTLGITPTRPETGYGYILRGGRAGNFGGVPVYRAVRFTEKPDLETAIKFLSSGSYLWNSGMFAWRVDLILKCIERYMPDLHGGLRKIAAARDSGGYREVLNEVYACLPRLSVDYGIMEKADNTVVIPADFGWDDVGSWTALERYMQPDDRGNVLKGRGILLDTRNCFVYAPGRTVGAIGMEDTIVVVDGESLLVCRKDRAQEIKRITQALDDAGCDDVL